MRSFGPLRLLQELLAFGGHTYSIVVSFGFGKTFQYVQRATVRRIALPVFRIDNEDVYNPSRFKI